MNKETTETVGKTAATLTIVELGLGSLLHGFHIPLSGHFLSLNQIVILSRSSFLLKSKKASLKISVIASLLKSLSPAGKKLTPMLALAAQGFLYSLGVSLFGLNIFGLVMAVFLSSIWAFIQPVLIILLIFGKTSIDVANHFNHEVQHFIPNADAIILWIILILIIVKFLAGIYLSILAIKMSDTEFKIYQNFLIHQSKIKTRAVKSPTIGALQDLLNPLFIFTFILTIIFFIFSNSDFSSTLWALLRPLAVGYILFYVIRVYPVENLAEYLQKKGFTQFANNLEEAITVIKNFKQ